MLEDNIKKAIRNVPDFPKPGIMFKDITPIFENQTLCNPIFHNDKNKMADMGEQFVTGIEVSARCRGIAVSWMCHRVVL